MKSQELTNADVVKMAEDGDIKGLWKAITSIDVTNPWNSLDLPACMHLLLRALDVAFQRDPTGAMDATLAHMCAFAAYLNLRTEFFIHRNLLAGSSVLDSGHAVSSAHKVVEVLPDFISLQQHLAAMIECHARTQRLRALTRKRRTRRQTSVQCVGVMPDLTNENNGAANGAHCNGHAARFSLLMPDTKPGRDEVDNGDNNHHPSGS
jgi:hypothetical protein